MRSMRALRINGQRLPLAPLIILLPALIAGILAMHIWIGGHSTTPGAPVPAPHTISAESSGASAAAQTHAGPAGAHTPSVSGETAPAHGFDAQCGNDCGSMNMTMATCMLALVLLSLTLLVPPTAGLLRSVTQRVRMLPVLTRTSAPARTPSLVQLSISRT